MEQLLRLAKRKSVCPEFTHKLLAAFVRRANLVEKLVSESLIEPFSGRELDVLRLLAAGLDAPEIAEKLVVSANTVRTHIKSLYRKLNAHSRHEALAQAKELKLV